MPAWDSVDLLTRTQNLLSRPTSDGLFTPEKLYSWLTEAEAQWKPVIVTHYPDEMWTAPQLMTAGSDNKTFTFPGGAVGLLRFELMESRTGLPLKRGASWDVEADYYVESGGIRVPAGRSLSLVDGAPYVRMITEPGEINADTGSTIFPVRLRTLLPYTAAEIACRSGAAWGDPSYFEERASKLAWGANQAEGDIGLIGQLKTVDHRGGMAAMGGDGSFRYWRPNG